MISAGMQHRDLLAAQLEDPEQACIIWSLKPLGDQHVTDGYHLLDNLLQKWTGESNKIVIHRSMLKKMRSKRNLDASRTHPRPEFLRDNIFENTALKSCRRAMHNGNINVHLKPLVTNPTKRIFCPVCSPNPNQRTKMYTKFGTVTRTVFDIAMQAKTLL
uniref:Uncharacterized protein n=1 Tax=Romanomermis culicivorax TaxID=13658 RepID=A0A915KRV8_ROMCU